MPSSSPCVVLIASADLLPALTERASEADTDLLTFTDRDALRALETISKRRPGVVALEKKFAATARGAALINRIKADPSLAQSEIRILAHDTDQVRVSPRKSGDGTGKSAAAAVASPAEAPALDQRGTRRAPRYRIAGKIEVIVDGNQASLVDLSTLGAQVVSAAVLKPNQRVRVVLTDAKGTVRVSASVAWASFEIPPKMGPRYRAGLEFVSPDVSALDAYCQRHQA